MALDVSSSDEDSEVDRQWMEELEGVNELENNPDLDDEYFQFLTTDSKSMSKDKNCELMDSDDEEVDPRYEKFLASLKVDEFAYVLEPDDFNRLDKSIRYGEEDSSDDEVEINTCDELKNAMVGENANELEDSSTDSRWGDPEPGQGRTKLVIEKDVLAESVFPLTSSYEQSPVEEFNHIYEARCNSDAKRQKTQVLGKSRKVTDGQEGREINLMPDYNNLRSEQCPDEELYPVSYRPFKFNMPGGSKKRQQRQILGNLEKVIDGLEETEGVPPDDDYALYFKSTWSDGFDVIWADNSKVIAYDSDEVPNFLMDDGGSFGKGNSKHSLHSQECDPSLDGDNNCQYLGSPSSKKHCKFRERIMRILRRPYNPEELENLMSAITAQKPVGRYMDFRNGRERWISGNKMGKSYLDHYHDLKLKLQAAKDNHKKLNLLRGFFFYIQNVTSDGVFEPWRDLSCLEM